MTMKRVIAKISFNLDTFIISPIEEIPVIIRQHLREKKYKIMSYEIRE